MTLLECPNPNCFYLDFFNLRHNPYTHARFTKITII